MSPLEAAFLILVKKNKLTLGMKQEYKYYKFRFDFAWPDKKVAVELQSWQWHHTRTQLERDRWKSNIAQSNGWIVFQFSSLLLRKKPQVILGLLRKVLS